MYYQSSKTSFSAVGQRKRRKRHFSHDASLPTILSNLLRSRDPSFQNGCDGGTSVASANVSEIKAVIYLYCVDPEYVSELTVPSLPFLKLYCLFGHVSFPGSLSERRMVVFPQCKRVLDKVKDVVSPCVIEVISSVQFQVRI